MAAYLALRIKSGKLKYETVVKKYPQYKKEIDLILGGGDADERT
jgi:hypothetical protein